MSGLRFAAWGAVDFEGLERLKRRAYLGKVRKEIEPHGLVLHAGGQAPSKPHYQVMRTDKTLLYSGTSFREACTTALKVVDPDAHQSE